MSTTLNLWYWVASVLQGTPSSPFFHAESQIPPILLKSVIFLLWEGKSSSIPGLSCAKDPISAFELGHMFITIQILRICLGIQWELLV